MDKKETIIKIIESGNKESIDKIYLLFENGIKINEYDKVLYDKVQTFLDEKFPQYKFYLKDTYMSIYGYIFDFTSFNFSSYERNYWFLKFYEKPNGNKSYFPFLNTFPTKNTYISSFKHFDIDEINSAWNITRRKEKLDGLDNKI
jgi:hypothetical protein